MAARTFTQPVSLNQHLAIMPQTNGGTEKAPDRSQESAIKMNKSFPRDAREPLATDESSKSKPGVTFAAQDNLPKLPIPDLESTCKKYICALEPLQTRREHAETKAAVHDFLRGEGVELHEKLKKYATGRTSYIEQFCMLASPSYVPTTPI